MAAQVVSNACTESMSYLFTHSMILLYSYACLHGIQLRFIPHCCLMTCNHPRIILKVDENFTVFWWQCHFFLSQDRDVFDSKKKVKATTADGLEHKLTASQRKTMTFNRCLLLLYTNQVRTLFLLSFGIGQLLCRSKEMTLIDRRMYTIKFQIL